MIGPLIGMVHLGPLPGAPGFEGDLERVLTAAAADASTLEQAGFDAVVVENFGDTPFHADRVPPITVAAMTRAVDAVRKATGLPVGVNVLRNDALSGLAIAAATGASFLRVNVLTGWMITDQGPITGRSADLARLRTALGAPVLIAADVMVKHAVPPAGLSLEQAARDTWERGGADLLIVSGAATGSEVDQAELEMVRRACPGAPVLVGSGVTVDNVARLLSTADGVIVGTSIKTEGITTEPVDPKRAAALVSAAGA